MEESKSAIKILTGNIPLGRPRRRWEDNIRIDLKEIRINMRNRLDSAQDRDYCRTLVNAALNLRVSYAMELVNFVYFGSIVYFTLQEISVEMLEIGIKTYVNKNVAENKWHMLCLDSCLCFKNNSCH